MQCKRKNARPSCEWCNVKTEWTLHHTQMALENCDVMSYQDDITKLWHHKAMTSYHKGISHLTYDIISHRYDIISDIWLCAVYDMTSCHCMLWHHKRDVTSYQMTDLIHVVSYYHLNRHTNWEKWDEINYFVISISYLAYLEHNYATKPS